MSDLNGQTRQLFLKKAAIVILLLIGIGCIAAIAGKEITKRRAEAQLAALSESQVLEPVKEPDNNAEETTLTSPGLNLPDDVEIPEKVLDWDALYEENADIYAWITVPGTNVDYPILQSEEELDYYLDHNLDHSSGYPGCIYTRYHNSKDFEDANTVIYGHNMKDGSMFKTLHSFEDGQFFEEHPYVYVWQPERVMVYEIFAAYRFTDDDLLAAYDFTDKEVFRNYLDSLMNVRNLYVHLRKDTFVPLDENCHIITLSTCIAGADEVRYLVQAVRIGAGDAL